jgi:predicted methyltransferase
MMRLIALSLAIAYAALASAQSPHSHDHSFGDAAKWAQVFDDPKRDAWQKPHQVIQVLALKPDAVIADIGSGTGYFAMRFAHMVPKGRVYGLDTEPDMVKYLAERAKLEAAGTGRSRRPGGRVPPHRRP